MWSNIAFQNCLAEASDPFGNEPFAIPFIFVLSLVYGQFI